ncbi:MAG: hypothetical protein CVU38_10995 [Chloroflexi bacterium HGW-Chloroflexi-1]|nr:MAG: hypothetical protein CVU38_10995 [Chloroflexi bacterium HGW-Chloroflexi-1]
MTKGASRTTHHAARNTRHLAHEGQRAWLVLLVILLLSLALRVYRMDAQSLWYDEAVTAQVSAQGIAELTRWTADDIQPPLYYYLMAGWTRWAGRGEWALRFPSAFFGTLTVALFWALARRLFGQRSCGRFSSLAAAALAGLSPLYVYYAQEARMYTLLTFLGVLAGYALLRAAAADGANREWQKAKGKGQRAKGKGQRANCKSQIANRNTYYALRTTHYAVRWWVMFVLASTAMLYTHYFGAFLLLAYGLCFLGAWGPRALRAGTRELALRQLGWGALSAAAIGLLYAPWLPAMLTRYRVDRSYWQGSLKLGEALRHVAISFTTGAPETMLEPAAVGLLPWFGVVFAVAVIALAWGRGAGGRGQEAGGEEGRHALVYLSTCLLVPLLSVLALASRTPKFNARYLMLASPAYLLILAGGIGDWGLGIGDWLTRRMTKQGIDQKSNTQYQIPNIILSLALVVFLLATSVAALRNWFTDPAFTKAQWRELAATVRAQIAPDEAVLLVSGHASPAWDYYAPDIPRARLPDIDILDVDAVLGFDVGGALEQALRDKAGAWVVSWQAEAVDPVGFVPYFLDGAGDEAPVGQQFWHLELRHWRLRSDATYPTVPQPAHAQDANFDHKLELLGWDDPQNGKLTVYWRTLNTLLADYQVSLILEDAVGQGGLYWRWDGRPASYDYPTTRWRPGQALFGRYPLPLPPDAPSGDYFVTLAVYDANHPDGLDIRDLADNPAGKRVRLGPVWVTR